MPECRPSELAAQTLWFRKRRIIGVLPASDVAHGVCVILRPNSVVSTRALEKYPVSYLEMLVGFRSGFGPIRKRRYLAAAVQHENRAIAASWLGIVVPATTKQIDA